MDDKQKIKEFKRAYLDQTTKAKGLPENSNIYAWKTKKLKFTIISFYKPKLYLSMSSENVGQFMFASLSDHDCIEYIDLVDKTKNDYDFSFLQIDNQLFSYFVNNNFIKVPQNLVFKPKSVFIPNDINSQIDNLKDWADEEYKKSTKKLKSTTSIPKVSYDYFADIYDFDKMLSKINNSQFSNELNQCIEAYNKSMWYVCAAGLGGIIEHLMFLTLDNYGLATNRILSKNPTANNYINAFKRPEVGLESRQETFINILFSARNAVSHYNSGLTNKSLCDLLLTGIKDLYQDYYTKSLIWKEQTEI